MYVAIAGRESYLPCNVSPSIPEDSVVLILWYKEDTGDPIYTVDARTSPLSSAQHFPSNLYGRRVRLNISHPVSYLRINPVQAEDAGEYRCR